MAEGKKIGKKSERYVGSVKCNRKKINVKQCVGCVGMRKYRKKENDTTFTTQKKSWMKTCLEKEKVEKDRKKTGKKNIHET